MIKMDSRIEIVNEHMVVVDFGLLPLDGIDYVPDKNIELKEDSMRISVGGIFVLNSQYKGYKLLKDGLGTLMKLSDKQLITRQIRLLKKARTDINNLDLQFINIELERRRVKRKYDHESKH